VRPRASWGRVVAGAALLSAAASGCASCVKGDATKPAAPPPPSAPPEQGSEGNPPWTAPDSPEQGTRPSGVTYRVGPRRKHTTLGEVASLLAPGDLVLVDGDATYVEDLKLREAGTRARQVTLRGVRVNGKRPVLRGSVSTVELAGDHYVFEGFEVTGGASRCLYHHADDITVRDTAVHGCPGHGILSADDDSGALTLAYVEVYDAGSGEMKHPVYVTTDASAHPGSVFRMEHCYVHDGHGGNAVKSRAERNEIYYNWIEGATYDELGLFGPDGDDDGGLRRDSDVVGNVIRKTGSGFYAARLGGDGSGQSWGRYRFVNNTFLLSAGAAGGFRVTFGIDSLELHNNAFQHAGGGGIVLVKDAGTWKSGHPVILASGNLVPRGSELTASSRLRATVGPDTKVSDDPGFVDVTLHDVRPLAWSPLVGGGIARPGSPAQHPFPSPLAAPLYLPPLRSIEALGTASRRSPADGITIGAFER
jgi:hypothetical protein